MCFLPMPVSFKHIERDDVIAMYFCLLAIPICYRTLKLVTKLASSFSKILTLPFTTLEMTFTKCFGHFLTVLANSGTEQFELRAGIMPSEAGSMLAGFAP